MSPVYRYFEEQDLGCYLSWVFYAQSYLFIHVRDLLCLELEILEHFAHARQLFDRTHFSLFGRVDPYPLDLHARDRVYYYRDSSHHLFDFGLLNK